MSANDSIPNCCVCFEALGKYGNPTTLPCGHNGCLQCMAHIQRTRPQCPICRAAFSPTLELRVNTELRDLMVLATALTTVDHGDEDWQAVTSARVYSKGEGCAAEDSCGQQEGVALVPTAPPLHVDLRAVLEGTGDLMSLEPPKWATDSSSVICQACSKPFSFLVRSRHHCRVCGDLFCDACSSGRMLLPPRFLQAEPQRVCDSCGGILAPLQPLLAGTVSCAVQAPVHDATDWSVWRSLFNSPVSQRLEDDIYKSVNIARHFSSLGSLKPERGIPQAVLAGCAGLAILSVLKVGAGWSCGLGTGLVVARRANGSWSAPSSILSISAGVGWQLGAGLTDVVVVLRNAAAVRAFCGSQLGVGGSLSIAAGPLGREAAAKLALGTSGSGALCYSYSCSRGAYVGLGLEGTLVRTRDALNTLFYGRQLPAKALLLSDYVPPPAAATTLYEALDQLLFSVEQPGGLGQFSVRAEARAIPGAVSVPAGDNGAAAMVSAASAPVMPSAAGGAPLAAPPLAWGLEQGNELQHPGGGGHAAAAAAYSGGQALSSPGSPASHSRARGRERGRSRAGGGEDRVGLGGAAGPHYPDVAGGRPLWHVPSAPAYAGGWDEEEPLPSLFD